jgi:hypothetical protein
MPRTYKAVPECTGFSSRDLAASLGLPWKSPGMPRLIIGRREWISLPDLGISPLKAKVDTGARSSSLHAENLQLSEDKKTVRFITFDHHRRKIDCECPVSRIARVKSSTGEAFSRVFIETKAILPGGFEWTIQISLNDRSVMLCPMLLGRRALSGWFLVDTQYAHLMGSLKEL